MIIIFLYFLFIIALFFLSKNVLKKFSIPALVFFILLPILYFWAYLTVPFVYNFHGQMEYKNYLKKALTPYLKDIKNLKCYCLHCDPKDESRDAYCGFQTSPNTIEKIAQHLELKNREFSKNELSIYRFCGERTMFTKTYYVAEGNERGVAFYYNEPTHDVCFRGFFAYSKSFKSSQQP